MTNSTATSGGNTDAKLMPTGELLVKQVRAAAQLTKSSKGLSSSKPESCAEPTSESRKGITSLKGWTSPGLP